MTAGKNKSCSGGRPVSKAALKDFLAWAVALAEPILAGMGLELVMARSPLVGGRPVIRLFIDRPGPAAVSLNDCASVSRALEAALEAEEAAAPDGYVLEISSPGLDRPLLKPEDCLRFKGRLARLKIRRGGASGVYRGRLTVSETGGLALQTETGRLDFDWSEVVSGRLALDEAIV
jgi:ribosome maturation factor RimP